MGCYPQKRDPHWMLAGSPPKSTLKSIGSCAGSHPAGFGSPTAKLPQGCGRISLVLRWSHFSAILSVEAALPAGPPGARHVTSDTRHRDGTCHISRDYRSASWNDRSIERSGREVDLQRRAAHLARRQPDSLNHPFTGTFPSADKRETLRLQISRAVLLSS